MYMYKALHIHSLTIVHLTTKTDRKSPFHEGAHCRPSSTLYPQHQRQACSLQKHRLKILRESERASAPLLTFSWFPLAPGWSSALPGDLWPLRYSPAGPERLWPPLPSGSGTSRPPLSTRVSTVLRACALLCFIWKYPCGKVKSS